jgi:hypothetical protein
LCATSFLLEAFHTPKDGIQVDLALVKRSAPDASPPRSGHRRNSGLRLGSHGTRSRRILLTNEKDFAELAFLQRRVSSGIVLLRLPIEVVEGRPEERRRFYRRRREGFLVTNYEQVIRDVELIHAWNPDIVVLDEAQRIKNWATKTAATVKRLRSPWRLILTGTPMENRLEELASLFDWIDDLALEPKWRLAPFHAVAVDGRREVAGARNLDTLRLRLGERWLRRRRTEVLRQLPPRTDTTVPVELTEAQRDEHDALNQPIARLVAIAQSRPLAQAEFLRLMSLLTAQRMAANGIALLNFAQVWEGISAVGKPDEGLLRSLSSPKLLELREILAGSSLPRNGRWSSSANGCGGSGSPTGRSPTSWRRRVSAPSSSPARRSSVAARTTSSTSMMIPRCAFFSPATPAGWA